MIASALATKAIISLLRDDHESARSRLREALEMVRETDDLETAPTVLSVAGTIAAIQHEPIAAAKL